MLIRSQDKETLVETLSGVIITVSPPYKEGENFSLHMMGSGTEAYIGHFSTKEEAITEIDRICRGQISLADAHPDLPKLLEDLDGFFSMGVSTAEKSFLRRIRQIRK